MTFSDIKNALNHCVFLETEVWDDFCGEIPNFSTLLRPRKMRNTKSLARKLTERKKFSHPFYGEKSKRF